ncbi:MFS general substrate transporter [Artomyces pyxidatus]|uniref:MFS general substrate transporter n=1 Tax=Artomyces pyxidatus TaxID=48021 RepID=A0ACB8TB08_9AGAM|nr:MFS general substrate transporter [Artomyces pyxidatus]
MNDDKTLILEKRLQGVIIDAKDADVGAAMVAGESVDLDPSESLKIRKRIDKHVLPLMCFLFLFQQIGQATLGYSAILGIQSSAHLTTGEFNWLGTIYYIGYLVGQYPQSLALQRYPVGKWMSLNVLVWGIALICQAACTSFAGLFVLRLIFGICEGSTVAGFMITNSMFWTREEQLSRLGYWWAMTGTAQIVGGLISFGSLHVHTKTFQPWQWFFVIIGALTLLTGVAYYFFYPDSPTNAWFLTKDEQVKAIQRVKANQTGIENKHFKKEQGYSTRLIETLADPKTWLIGVFGLCCGLTTGGLAFQRQMIVSSIGFSDMQTSLLGCVDGAVQIVSIASCVVLASRIRNSRAWLAMAYFIPCLLGAFLINFLPWTNKIGLLFSVWLMEMNGASLMLLLVWMGQITAGHTKKVLTNAILLSTSSVGGAVVQFLWQAKYRPRNHVPWIVTGIFYAVSVCSLFAMRVIVDLRNKRRDADSHGDTYEDLYVIKLDEDGNSVRFKVDKDLADLTDMQNQDFRYSL